MNQPSHTPSESTEPPHGDSGGTRSPAGTDYGDFHHRGNPLGEREQLNDDVKDTQTPPPVTRQPAVPGAPGAGQR